LQLSRCIKQIFAFTPNKKLHLQERYPFLWEKKLNIPIARSWEEHKRGDPGKMGSVLLPTLRQKREVDAAIRDTIDKVLVLRFGRAADAACLHLDDLVSANPRDLFVEPICPSPCTNDRVPLVFYVLQLVPRGDFGLNELVIVRSGYRCSLLVLVTTGFRFCWH
jgi:hypothetical protein